MFNEPFDSAGIAEMLACVSDAQYPSTIRLKSRQGVLPDLPVWGMQICGHHAVLVGDAAHAVTSVLGQGCNTALSTCTALDRAMTASDTNGTEQLDQALEQYNADWLPQAHALQQLEYMSVSPCTAISFSRANTICTHRTVADECSCEMVKMRFCRPTWPPQASSCGRSNIRLEVLLSVPVTLVHVQGNIRMHC